MAKRKCGGEGEVSHKQRGLWDRAKHQRFIPGHEGGKFMKAE